MSLSQAFPTRESTSSFIDIIPLRKIGQKLNLSRPSLQDIQFTTERTRKALASQVAIPEASLPASQLRRQEPIYLIYAATGTNPKNAQIVEIVDQQLDPTDVPKYCSRRIPHGPWSPPRPVLHSTLREMTNQEQTMWIMPLAISNWKSLVGLQVPLDKREKP